MSRRDTKNGILNGVLLVLIALFLSIFIRTCFGQKQAVTPEETKPVTQVEQPAVAAPVVVQPVPETIPEEPKQTVSAPEKTPEPEAVEETPELAMEEEPTAEPEPTGPAIPEPPTMYDPFVCTQEDYEMFYNVQSTDNTDEDDPFADFVVSGEDEAVSYDDGQYYLTLYVNDEYAGDIETQFASPDKLINMNEFYKYVGEMLTTDASQRIFADQSEFMSLEELKSRGVDITFDSSAFALYCTLDYADLSVRTLSVSTQNVSRNRDKYVLSGALDLKPAKFSMSTAVSAYGSITYPTTFNGLTSHSLTLYLNNNLAFLQTGVNFSLSVYDSSPYYTLGNWTAFHDFLDSYLRLTFGSVGSNLSVRTPDYIDTNVGFKLEKSYSYGAGQAMSNQFQYTIDIIEPSKLEIYVNANENDKDTQTATPVFSRENMQAGTYRLKDFVFTQGNNVIKIVITPNARPDDPDIYYVDTSYDSRLMAKGDYLYGYGVSMPRGNSKTEYGGAFHFYDYLRQSYLSYFPQYSTARFWQNIGLTDTFTLSSDLSATPGVFSGTLNGLWANAIGTTQMQATVKYNEKYTVPLLSGSITERFNDSVMKGIGTLSLSFSANTPAPANSSFIVPSTGKSSNTTDLASSMVGSFSFSSKGLLTKVRYSLSGSMSYTVGNSYPTWSLSGSTGFSPLKGLSLSGSVTFSGSDNTNMANTSFSATISGSYSFSSKANASTSTSFSKSGTPTSSFGLSYRPTSKDSLSLTLSSLRYNDPLNHSLLASWSHTGKVSTMSLRQQVSNSYKQMTTSLNLSTAFAFADGVLGMGRTVSDVFLLVKPEGELKKSQISVARSMDSSPQVIQKYFGSALFNNLSAYVKNNVVVYGGGADAYSTTASFMYQFTPRGRQAYVVHIDLPPTFTVSGVLKHQDGSFYEQYSSPVYHVTYDENGVETLSQDADLYLFTDQEGRFILSSIAAGDYSFDLQISDNTWYAVKFTVPEMGKDKKLRVVEYNEITDAGPYDEKGFDGYDQTMTLTVKQLYDEESFWNLIFPAVD